MLGRMIDITLFITDRMRAGVFAFLAVAMLRLAVEVGAPDVATAQTAAPPSDAASVVMRLPKPAEAAYSR